ncbi:MAG: hypothetical protein GTN67_00125 [Hydrotalea flava]|nr:hypothetical protein [Hydrotalea flava]NIM36741.1 hypothetical protein [Hydrotalea flava]NIN01927.1 hypothetical protein [Hydrotalea flava]NIN13585.1 hypothetical protein [Hydrotalea flava]NIO92667.1 hypothetical protein [Hydrotalea flava]
MDAQTLLDLEILESTDGKKNHLFHLLNHTITQGGEDILKQKLVQPFLSAQAIHKTQAAIQHCMPFVLQWKQIISERIIVMAELYLQSNIQITILEESFIDKCSAKLFQWQHPDYFHYLHTNIVSLQNLFFSLDDFLSKSSLSNHLSASTIQHKIKTILEKIIKPHSANIAKRSAFTTLYIDKLLRSTEADSIKNILEWIYETDAIMSMATACSIYQLQFPEISEESGIEISNLQHLLVQNPIVNNVSLTNQNVMFITGPNMAGKTTYLKAIAHAIILTHIGMGIPVSAAKIGIVRDLFSFIGITDSISKGESYFQAEINRIQFLANSLQKNYQMAVIIDEPFKGTNIKDALDCSILFTQLALKWAKSFFIIATHLTEVYDSLHTNNKIVFYYFETRQEGDKLIFDYKCRPGLSNQRLGLAIFKKTGLPELMQPKKQD